MGLNSVPGPEKKREKPDYKEAIEKANQLWEEAIAVSGALTMLVPGGQMTAAEAREKSYQWRDKYMDFVNNQRPSMDPAVFLKEGVSYQDAEKMSDQLDMMAKNILIQFFVLQRDIDKGGAR